MNETKTYVAGEGPLTCGRVLGEAWGMFRRHYWRVALVALILFVPPPLLAAVLEGLRESLEVDAGLIRGLGYVIGLLMVTMIRLFGPVVYAGYLDEAVGLEYFHGRHVRFRDVLRSLPWVRLIIADLILVIGTGIGLSLFVVPGLIWLTLFTLVGPVLVQERHGVVEGFRRTFQLARGAWVMIFVLVVALLAFENVVHEVVHQQFHHSSIWLQVASSWLVAALIGGIVGLVEVALATELMARSPLETNPEPEQQESSRIASAPSEDPGAARGHGADPRSAPSIGSNDVSASCRCSACRALVPVMMERFGATAPLCR